MSIVMPPFLRLAAWGLIGALSAPVGATAQPESEPILSISHDDARDAVVIHASIDIEAPPATVWAVITDCSRAPTYVPNMESCRIIAREPHGRWQVRETVHNVMLLPRIHSVSRVAFDDSHRLSFRKAGGDMRIAEGEWRLESLERGHATRLRYDAVLALNISVPRFLLDGAANRDVPALMRNVARESLKDEAKKK